MSYTRSDLMELDKMYKQSVKEAPASSDVPEGRYQARITKAELVQSQSGTYQVHMVYKIVGGSESLVGAPVDSWEGLRDPRNMGFFRKKMARMKVKFASFTEVPALLTGLIGAVVEIAVVHKGEYVNVYVNKLISKGTGAPKAAEPVEEEAADVDEDGAEETTAGADQDANDADASEDEEDLDDPNGNTADDDVPVDEEDDTPADDTEQVAGGDREYPTQAEVGRMKDAEIAKLLGRFKVKALSCGKDARRIAQALVCGYEDDDDSGFDKATLAATLKAIGRKPETKPTKAWAAILGYLEGLGQ